MTEVWEPLKVDTPRGTFEVFRNGDGKPLCVTHLYSAFNQTGDHFAHAFLSWRTVYLVNLRDAGNSPRVRHQTELSMDMAVDDLDAIRAALGVAAWDYAGHSTGGMLGLKYALAHPESLGALIVAGAAASHHYNQRKDCIYHPDHPQFGRMQQLLEQLKDPRLPDTKRQRLTRQRTELSLYQPEHYDRYFDGRVTKRLAPSRLEYFSAWDFSAFDVRTRLANIHLPVLVACGRHDVQCPFWCSEEMHQRIPGSYLAEFASSNHYPFLEEPDKFQRVVEALLHTRDAEDLRLSSHGE